MRTLKFAKGEATLNDFVILADPDDYLSLSADEVRYLCDRRAGIGGDGLIRVVHSQYIPQWNGETQLWFMDYWNADGSVAEMCGNGLRLFTRYLIDNSYAETDHIQVATRAGLKEVWALEDGRIKAGIGVPVIRDQQVTIELGDARWLATAVSVGNPHAVVTLAETEDIVELDLTNQPKWNPEQVFPDGVNIEFIAEMAPRQLKLRVFERGVGETKSCGTGVVASVAAYAQKSGYGLGKYQVSVPGGELEVQLSSNQAYLIGPANVVAIGEVKLPD